MSPAVPLRRSRRFARALLKSDSPAHVLAILPAADVMNTEPLVVVDATRVAAHHCSSQPYLDQADRHLFDDSGACSPDALVNSEPNENLACISVLPFGTMSTSRELLGNTSADNTERSRVVLLFTATLMARRLLGRVQADSLPRPFASVLQDDIVLGWSSLYTRDTTSSSS